MECLCINIIVVLVLYLSQFLLLTYWTLSRHTFPNRAVFQRSSIQTYAEDLLMAAMVCLVNGSFLAFVTLFPLTCLTMLRSLIQVAAWSRTLRTRSAAISCPSTRCSQGHCMTYFTLSNPLMLRLTPLKLRLLMRLEA